METSKTITKGIMVTVRDRINNKSKSFTVYSDDLDEIYEILKKTVEKAK